jgi:hypothetical protein
MNEPVKQRCSRQRLCTCGCSAVERVQLDFMPDQLAKLKDDRVDNLTRAGCGSAALAT